MVTTGAFAESEADMLSLIKSIVTGSDPARICPNFRK
jgi:hypothetical protein